MMMDKYTFERILDVTNETGVLDYIISCTSGFHLLSCLAFLSFLHNHIGRNLCGVVIICEHYLNGYLIDENSALIPEFFGVHFFKRNKDDKVFYLNCDEKITCKNETIYIASVTKPWVKMVAVCQKKFNCSVKSVIIDEGIGNYSSFFFRFFGTYKESHNLIRSIKEFAKELYSYVYIKIHDINMFKFLILKRKKLQYYENSEVSSFFQSARIFFRNKNKNFEYDAPYVLIITQPFQECFNIDGVMGIFSSIRDDFAKEGIKTYFKIHPRDDSKIYEKNGFNVIKGKDSIEGILATVKEMPVFVCGYNSTALITTKIIYDIPTYSLGSIMLKLDNVGSRTFKKYLKEFDKKFSNIVPSIEMLDFSSDIIRRRLTHAE